MIAREYQVSDGHYDWSYSDKARWVSYWHQIDEVLSAHPASCLEVGMGSGIVQSALRTAGVALTTVDIDDRLDVDRVGSVTDLPAADDEFDVVLCAQVLEHLPWDQFPIALRELARIARHRVVVSLPQSGRSFKLDIALPLHRDRRWRVVYQTPARTRHEFDGQHYWQVGAAGSWPSAVRRIMNRDFVILREYIVPENMYHRFYVLQPRTAPEVALTSRSRAVTSGTVTSGAPPSPG